MGFWKSFDISADKWHLPNGSHKTWMVWLTNCTVRLLFLGWWCLDHWYSLLLSLSHSCCGVSPYVHRQLSGDDTFTNCHVYNGTLVSLSPLRREADRQVFGLLNQYARAAILKISDWSLHALLLFHCCIAVVHCCFPYAGARSANNSYAGLASPL